MRQRSEKAKGRLGSPQGGERSRRCSVVVNDAKLMFARHWLQVSQMNDWIGLDFAEIAAFNALLDPATAETSVFQLHQADHL
jgi:hypothetical protein